MVNVLFVNPGKWGRGITPIWIASHCAVLKNKGFNVDLFDATFYKSWAENENDYNTKNNQYSPSDYGNYIKFSSKDIKSCLQEKLNVFKPDYIFFSALSRFAIPRAQKLVGVVTSIKISVFRFLLAFISVWSPS